MAEGRYRRDPTRPVYVISVAASILEVHPRTLRIYEDEGLVCPARTPTNIRLYSENDIRRVLWIRHLTQDRGVNLAGIRILFELEERLGTRILEALFDEGRAAAGEPEGGLPENREPSPREPISGAHDLDEQTLREKAPTQRTDPPSINSQPRARFTRIVTTRITSRANVTGDSDA